MGLGPVINGRQQPVTPRDGKAWADTVNAQPMPAGETRKALALGKCNADGSNFQPYEKPVEREAPASRPTGSYLWLGDYRL